MRATDFSQQSEDYQRIEKAIRFIENNFTSQPTLDQIAESVHLSKYHFNRLFKRWAGISPIQFQQILTLEYAKEKLSDARSLLDTAFDAGLSGPGRLHDLFVTFEAMTPGEFKKMGAGLEISYGFDYTPFGQCLVAVTERGICHLGFVDKDNRAEAFNHLQQNWPEATLFEEETRIHQIVSRIFCLKQPADSRPFNLHLKYKLSSKRMASAINDPCRQHRKLPGYCRTDWESQSLSCGCQCDCHQPCWISYSVPSCDFQIWQNPSISLGVSEKKSHCRVGSIPRWIEARYLIRWLYNI